MWGRRPGPPDVDGVEGRCEGAGENPQRRLGDGPIRRDNEMEGGDRGLERGDRVGERGVDAALPRSRGGQVEGIPCGGQGLLLLRCEDGRCEREAEVEDAFAAGDRRDHAVPGSRAGMAEAGRHGVGAAGFVQHFESALTQEADVGVGHPWQGVGVCRGQEPG